MCIPVVTPDQQLCQQMMSQLDLVYGNVLPENIIGSQNKKKQVLKCWLLFQTSKKYLRVVTAALHINVLKQWYYETCQSVY